jgi:hypothetical protein
MRYNSSRHENCPPLQLSFALLLLAFASAATNPLPLFESQLLKDRSFRIKMDGSPNAAFTIFGWVQVQTPDKSHELNILTISKSILDDVDRPAKEGTGEGTEFVSRLLLRNNQLAFSVRKDLVNLEGSTIAVELNPETWYHLVYSFDLQTKTATVFLSDPLGSSDQSEIRLSHSISDERLNGFIEAAVEFGKDDGDKQKAMIKFRDFSLVSSSVKNPSLLHYLPVHVGTRFVDYILSVKSIDEIDKFRATTHSEIKEHKIGFMGKNIRSTENGSMAFQSGSFIEFPNIPQNEANKSSQYYTVYLKLKITPDLSDKFLLFSSSEKSRTTELNFEVRLVHAEKSDRRLVILFPQEKKEITTEVVLKTDIVQEVFISFVLSNNRNVAIAIKAQDSDKLISVKLERSLTQAIFWILPPSEKSFQGEVTLYRIFISENVIPILVPAIIGCTSSKLEPSSCAFPINSFINATTHCLTCQNALRLNPVTHACESDCNAGRRNSHGVCVECFTPDCSEVESTPEFQISRVRPNEFKIKVGQQNIETNDLRSISENFEFFAASDPDKKLKANKKLLEAEQIVFELAGNPNKFANKEIVVTLHQHQRLLSNPQSNEGSDLSWQFTPVAGIETMTVPPKLVIDSSLKTMETAKPASQNLVVKIIALVVIAIFAIGLLFGIAGCLLPLSLSANSFFHQKVIQATLVFQYICLWSIYSGSMNSFFGEFLGYLFKYSIGVQQLFVTNDSHLPLNSDRNIFLHSKNITARFVNNVTIMLMVQAAVVLIFLTLSLFRKGDSLLLGLNSDSTAKMTFSRWIFTTQWRAIFSVFMMMTIEISFFATIEFFNFSFSNLINIVSFAIAVLLCTILVIQLIIVTVHSIATRQQINDVSGLAFASSSLQSGLRRLFLPIQTCFFISFGVILALPFKQDWIPVAANYAAVVLLTVAGFCRFPEKQYWRNEQTVMHLLFWLANSFFVVLKFDSTHGFINETVSRVLSYGAILFTGLVVLWNSVVVSDSLIREVKAERRRIHLQNLFVVRMVGAQESFQRVNKSAIVSVDKNRQTHDSERSFFRFSAKNIYSYSDKKNEFSKLKATHSAEVLVKDDDAIKTKLASMNFPSKLAQLKFCQFPSSENIGSFRSLNEKHSDNKSESGSNAKLSIRVKEDASGQKMFSYQNQKDSANDNSKSKASTRDTSGLRPMSQEISFSASHNIFDSGIKQHSNPSEVKFNQILTHSKLMQLKDSVSFAKKRYGESELDASATERTILPANYYSSRVIGAKKDNELAPTSRVTNFSDIHFVCDEYANEEDTQTIDDLNNGFSHEAPRDGIESPLELSKQESSSRLISEKNILPRF